jgi:hypothetical protein
MLGAFKVFHHKVIGGMGFQPPGLSPGEDFQRLEVIEILVLTLHLDIVFSALEEMPPLLLCVHNGQQLLIICVIILFSWRALPVLTIDWPENLKNIPLNENAGNWESILANWVNNQLGLMEILVDR